MSKLTLFFIILTIPLFSQAQDDNKSKKQKIIDDIKILNELIKNRDLAFLNLDLNLENKPQNITHIDPLYVFYGYQFLIFDKFEDLRNRPLLSRKQKRELKRMSAKINHSEVDRKVSLYYFLNLEYPSEPLE